MTTSAGLSAVLPAESLGEASDAEAIAERLGRIPAWIVKPGTTEEVAAVMTWASRERVGVLPLASGARAGRVRSDQPFVALLTERLVGVEQYEAGDLTITARAGSRIEDIDGTLRAQGQWLPFDPAHYTDRSLGGLVSCGESGPLWMGYGALRNHVLGMTVVTGDGRVLRLGGRVVKNVAGFDLLKLMVGGRGAVGVVTSVCVRAFPIPAEDHLLVHTADSVGDLAEPAVRVGTAPVMPASCVVVDGTEAFDGAAALVVRLHGAEKTVEADRRTIEGYLGVAFETVDLSDRLLATVRDHAADGATVLVANARPSRLGEVLRALDDLDPSSVHVDAYAGRVRVAIPRFDGTGIAAATESIELVGGSTRVVRSPGSESPAGVGSTPSKDEADLVRSLYSCFDPEGVLWPARR